MVRKKSGFQIIIYSNGSLINQEIAKELKHLGLNKVDLTIPAISKSAFEQITAVSGSRDRVFRAIELLKKNGVNLGLKTSILKENISEIKEIEDFARSLGALHRLSDVLSPRLDGSKGAYRYRGKLIDNLVVSRQSSVVSRKLEAESPILECGLPTDNRQLTTENFLDAGQA